MQHFRGQYEHTIDKKGRVSIPAAFRQELQKRSESHPILIRETDHLELFVCEEWEAFESTLFIESHLKPEVKRLQRIYAANSCECPIDSQGRILLPQNAREHASLGSKCIIAGALNRIEIWEPKAYALETRAGTADFAQIQMNVDQTSRRARGETPGGETGGEVRR